jgi:hypothetical protein
MSYHVGSHIAAFELANWLQICPVDVGRVVPWIRAPGMPGQDVQTALTMLPQYVLPAGLRFVATGDCDLDGVRAAQVVLARRQPP